MKKVFKYVLLILFFSLTILFFNQSFVEARTIRTIETIEELKEAFEEKATIEGNTIKLIDALQDTSKRFYKENIIYPDHHFLTSLPEMVARPRVAFHAPLKVVDLEEAENKVSKEMIMIYPPGIPVIIPGEVFTKEVIQEINYYLKKKATILSDWDGANEVSVVDEDED